MITKKKLTKQTTKPTAKKATKSNRGRPRKEFKPKHKRMLEQQQLATPMVEHRLPTRERILRMPSKDKSIFYLFIFSILLFLCSLTISFLKKDKLEDLQDAQENVVTETGATEENAVNKIPNSATQTIENMY